MKIASFNVNGIRARLPIVLRWLEQESPDVLCVQETKVQDKDFPVNPLTEAGYCCNFRGQKSYNGVAVLSKQAPRKVTTGFDDGDEKEGPRLMRVDIDGIEIVNAYVPQGQVPGSDQFDYKIDWLRRLRNYFEANFAQDRPLVWTGDFNVAPEPEDVYDPQELLGSVGYHPEEHAALKDIEKWGFVDVYRRHNPDEIAFTFWDYRIPNAVKRGLGWRIDHIWANPCAAERSTAAWIDREPRLWQRPSDHTVVVAEFEF